MKKIAFAVAIALTASTAMALGNSHNFAISATGADACKFCHIPHGANTGMAGAPLWNRDTKAATGYNYKNTTIHTTTINAPGDRSLTCLSCHDGSTAVNDLYGSITLGNQGNVTGTANIGTDLTNDHPVGVAYGGTAVGLFARPVDAGVNVALGTGRVECSTCHEPHNSLANFLRLDNAGGALCVTCHNK